MLKIFSRGIIIIFFYFFILFLTLNTGGEPYKQELLLLQPHCESQQYFSVDDVINPDIFSFGIGTVRTYEGCLQRLRDRFVVVTPQHNRASPKLLKPCQEFLKRNETLVLYYLASDLCRLGHSTKDAPHLMTFLIDYLSPCSLLCKKKENLIKLRVNLTIIYGNICASYPSPKLDGSFKGVILGWFHAVFHTNSPFIQLMSSWGIDFIVFNSNSSSNKNLHINEIFFKEAMAGGSFFCPGKTVFSSNNSITSFKENNNYLPIIVRWERFRWFRTSAQANLFRNCLLKYYNVPHPKNNEINLLLLRRLGERHFEESIWYKKLQTNLKSCGVSILMQTFISMPYNIQTSFIHNSSILIASHGAGVVNMMTMIPGSVVIELFPHGFRYAMYEELANLLGLNYIPYESPIVWPKRCCKVLWEDSMTNFTPILKGYPPKTSFGTRSCKECDIKISENDMNSIINDALGLVFANRRLEMNL